MSRLILTMGLLITSACVGCGKSEPVLVRGTLMYKGKPVPNVKMTLFNKDDDKISATALSDEAGKFSFAGAVPGNYTLMVMQSTSGNGAKQEEFPVKYSAYGESGHEISVGWFGMDNMVLELKD